MNNKKFKFILGTLTLPACLLASCGGSTTSQGTTEITSVDGSTTSETTTSKSDGGYDLTYRSWDYGTVKLNNAERQLVKAFEEANNVKINIVENPGSGENYWINIAASVTKNTAADVFMTPNLDYPLASEYALDLSSLTSKDDEWSTIPSSISDAVKFKSGIYAIPCRLNMAGYFLNMSIADEYNMSDLSYTSSFDDVKSLLDKVKNKQSYVGLNYVDKLYELLPSAYDNKLGYFTWDGEKYNLDSDAFKSSIAMAKGIYDSKESFDGLSESQRNLVGNGSLNSDGMDVDAWDKGYMALRYGFTYEIPDMLSKNPQFEVKFLGNPGGKTPLIGDYYCIYKNTKNPELAYKFAKWMSFGKEGMLKRFDLYSKSEVAGYHSNTLPLTNDKDVLDKYFELFPDSYENYTGEGIVIQDVRKTYETLATSSMPEGVKVVPGYNQSRWKAKTGLSVTISNPSDPANPTKYENAEIGQYLDACVKGNGNLNENISAINTLANKEYTDWLNKYGVKYN